MKFSHPSFWQDPFQAQSNQGSLQSTNLGDEKLQLQESLHRTQQALGGYRTLYESIPFIYFTLDTAGNILHVNSLGLTYLGCAVEELVASSIWSVLHPDDRHLLATQFTDFVQNSHATAAWQFRLMSKDGQPTWVKAFAKQVAEAPDVQLSQKPATMILVFCEDITEHKQIEAELQLCRAQLEERVHERTTTLHQTNQNLQQEIIERQQAEAANQQQQQILQTIFDHIPLMVAFFDAQGQIRMVNQEWERILGWSYADTQNRDMLSEFYPDPVYRQRVLNFILRANGKWADFQTRVRDGQVTNTSWVNVKLSDGSSIGIGQDITERKQAEEALWQWAEHERIIGEITQRIRQSLHLQEILQTTVAEVQHFLQADRVLIYRVWQDGTGSAVTESVVPGQVAVLGQTFPEEVFPTEYQQLYAQGRTRAIDNIDEAEVSPCLAEFVQQFQVKAKLVVPILQGQALWGLLIAHQCDAPRQWQELEITLLKQLATQLAIAIQQSELYQQVQSLNSELERKVQQRTAELELAFEFEATLKRITDKVRDSLDEKQILQTAVQELALAIGVKCCNAALYDVDQGISTISYEYTAGAAPFYGRVIQMSAFPEIYDQLLQGQAFQFCSIVPNPVRGLVAMLTCPILDNQEVLGDLWLVHDQQVGFSDQEIRLVQQVANQCAIALRQARLYQTAQAQVEELERLNRLKDDFLSTVSHELRTPMANIKMATQMLEVTLQSAGVLNQEPNKISRYFQILHHESQREANLINDLLDLTRLDAKTEPLVLTAVNLQDWLPTIVEPFQERTRNRQQQLQSQIPVDLPSLMTDLFSLGRIVAELINNACKYTPPEETIVITAHATATTMQIRVCNSGVEIPASECDRIFEKFYRIPNGDPWKHGGTGLGLALVKKLVERLEGSIQVENSPGQTCFLLEFPLLMKHPST